MDATDQPPVPAMDDEGDGKAPLLNAIIELCQKYRFNTRGRERTQAVLAMLISETCERRVRFMLANPGARDETEFDPYYREKSDMAVSMVVSSVIDTLAARGLQAGLATESRDVAGTYDVVIQKGNPSLIIRRSQLIGRIEVKASWGLPLPQIARYMLGPSPLIISRVMAGTAVVVDPLEHEAFVRFTSELLTSEATRILGDVLQVVPGRYCGDCGDRDCPYYEGTPAAMRRVMMGEPAFEADLKRFFGNLPRVCEKTSQLVLNLVNEAGEAA